MTDKELSLDELLELARKEKAENESKIERVKSIPLDKRREIALDTEDEFEIKALSEDDSENSTVIRRLVALNKNLPEKIALEMARFSDDCLKLQLINNENSSEKVLNVVLENFQLNESGSNRELLETIVRVAKEKNFQTLSVIAQSKLDQI